MRPLSLLVIAVAVAASLLAAPALPEVMAMHWNAYGQADGFGPKALALAMLPAVMAALLVVFEAVRRGMPEGARRPSDAIGLVTMLFLLFVHAVTIAVGLGHAVRVERVVPFGIALLFVAMGAFMEHVPQNRFVGVRTPWTLKSPEVWRTTHRFTARFFGVGGALLAVACLAGAPFWAVVTGFGVLALVPVGYSLLAWRRLPARPS